MHYHDPLVQRFTSKMAQHLVLVTDRLKASTVAFSHPSVSLAVESTTSLYLPSSIRLWLSPEEPLNVRQSRRKIYWRQKSLVAPPEQRVWEWKLV